MIDFLFAKDSVAFVLPGGFEIYKYALMITFGIIASFALYLLLAKKRGIDLDFSLELFIWVIPMAVIFCRVFYVVPRLGKEYSLSSWEGFLDAIDIRGGGLTIIGGIFGGALGIFLCCLRNRKYSMMRVADCVVIALFVGQIIGRWGNYFNEELYGIEVTNTALQHFPFAVYIESLQSWHYASFFYEGVLNSIGLIIALLLFYLPKKPLKIGTFSIFYLAWYGLVRGSLEFIKGSEPVTIGNTGIKMVQLICYLMCIVAIVLQILLQCGKIRLETKWFERLCEKRKIQLQEKAAAKAAAENVDGASDIQVDSKVEDSANAQSQTLVEDGCKPEGNEDIKEKAVINDKNEKPSSQAKSGKKENSASSDEKK
ncbi:MAG: prolipoprotein diacylglyceryl transferase [Clostridia bacterium]|nr:prolipoprotein diacylglyceryl transferase [Clostridia bacterium]MDE7328305.1 prolipoprotein diacylglyceryl transferase [Clostridia bacterium]